MAESSLRNQTFLVKWLMGQQEEAMRKVKLIALQVVAEIR
jgi:hypothetical protein